MSNLLRVMISQPMAGRTDEEIRSTRDRLGQALRRKGYDVIDSFFCDEWQQSPGENVVNVPLEFMSKSIHCMAQCHAVCFADGYKEARGCRVEERMAVDYGLKIIYEEELKC